MTVIIIDAKLIAIHKILPNPEQPRRIFDPAELQDLAQSIKTNGIIQPIVVEEAPKGMYILGNGKKWKTVSSTHPLRSIPWRW